MENDTPNTTEADLRRRIKEALEVAEQYGTIDGDHHKMWAIDQMVRRLTGEGYTNWVRRTMSGAEGSDTYEWSEGVPP